MRWRHRVERRDRRGGPRRPLRLLAVAALTGRALGLHAPHTAQTPRTV